MSRIMYQGSDLTTWADSSLRGLLDPKPRQVYDRIALNPTELEDTINGSLSGLAERVKNEAEILLQEYGDGEIEMSVENTGYYEDFYSIVFHLVRRGIETDEDAKARAFLATQALAVRAKASAKRKEAAEAKKIEKLKVSLAKLTEAERAELLKG